MSSSKVIINGTQVFNGNIKDMSVNKGILKIDSKEINLEDFEKNMKIEIKIEGDVGTLAVDNGNVS